MAVTQSTGLLLDKPDDGTKPWGTYFRGNMDILDQAISGVLSKSVAGSSDVTLTTTAGSGEAGNPVIVLTGALTGSINVIVPTKRRRYRIRNDTTGAFNLTVKGATGTGIIVPKGWEYVLQHDGTNVVLLEGHMPQGNLPTAAGTSTAITVSLVPTLKAYDTGQHYWVQHNTACGDSPTLNIDSLGAKNCKKWASGEKVALKTGDIPAGYQARWYYDGTDLVLLNPAMPCLCPGFIFGLGLANNGTDAVNDIDIAVGSAWTDSGASQQGMMTLASALTKRLDAAWAVGNGNGGLDTGTIADNTYHVHLIRRPDTGVVDVLFSLSASSPTMPSNYTQRRRIGSIIRAGSTILAFSQNGDEFLLLSPVTDVNVSNLSTTATLYTLSVPAGIKVQAIMDAEIRHATTTMVVIWLSSPDQTDLAPGAGGLTLQTQVAATWASGGKILLRTNTSGQIRARSSASSTLLLIITQGWIDTRGK